MGKEYFYIEQDNPRIPLGDKGELISRDGTLRKISFRSGVQKVKRREVSTSPPRLPGGFKTGEKVFASDTSVSWDRGERGKVLGSRSRSTVWVRFSGGKSDGHDVAAIALSRKRPRSPSEHFSEDEMPDPKKLEMDLRRKTGLLVRHFNPRYHYSYTSENVSNMTRTRGGEAFVPPLGYTKLALNIEGRYLADGWLDKKTGWHVAYHGTRCRPSIIKSIVLEGFKVNGGKTKAANGTYFGEGVYCTPDPRKAEQYVKNQPFVDRAADSFLVLFLCRVRPGSYQVNGTRNWLVKDALDIRPYAILLKDMDA